jgi:hypothetical protein
VHHAIDSLTSSSMVNVKQGFRLYETSFEQNYIYDQVSRNSSKRCDAAGEAVWILLP